MPFASVAMIRGTNLTTGKNHPGGVIIHYYLPDAPGKNDTIKLSLLESGGSPIVTFSNFPKEGEEKLEPKKGSNRFNWNLRYRMLKNLTDSLCGQVL